MQITIRKSVADDVKAIKRVLSLAHQDNTRKGYVFPAARIKLSKLREKMKKEIYYVLVFEKKIVGTVAIRRRNTYWEIGSLAVIPSYQKRGWGNKLLRYAEKKVKKQGGKRTGLFTIKRHPSLPSYYKKRGYQPVGKKSFQSRKWMLLLKNLSK
ncbi:GNAT family N-acetyltransferase [Ammoniphilus sp. 3BR4]|uniref:GNAT family N-acetyltransferase n=1 Tax=Ammoniphilus sp. 3BR4 TaxID=3158265 RepID=UPI0034667F2C